jgi:hypothetical protein
MGTRAIASAGRSSRVSVQLPPTVLAVAKIFGQEGVEDGAEVLARRFG